MNIPNIGPIYVSSVSGRVVARYGSGTPATKNLAIGARQTPAGYEWNADEVVEIPAAEYRRYRKEYGRALTDGALRLRTKAERDAFLAKQQAPKTDPDLSSGAKVLAAMADVGGIHSEAPTSPADAPAEPDDVRPEPDGESAPEANVEPPRRRSRK